MMRQMMHTYHGGHGRHRASAPEPGEREIRLDAISWAAFLIWIGASWLAGMPFGTILVGAGIVILLAQGARSLVDIHVEGFWVWIGCGFFAAGYWELWGLGIPLAPIVLIVAGVGLIAWQFLPRRFR